mmetsp:Transcript_4770/g.12254  ORF Transcript_4770/g.12254 Transcript_4770/m.12254 type:complete len:107 (+) Transcript_4770:1188-1508(+)
MAQGVSEAPAEGADDRVVEGADDIRSGQKPRSGDAFDALLQGKESVVRDTGAADHPVRGGIGQVTRKDPVCGVRHVQDERGNQNICHSVPLNETRQRCGLRPIMRR